MLSLLLQLASIILSLLKILRFHDSCSLVIPKFKNKIWGTQNIGTIFPDKSWAPNLEIRISYLNYLTWINQVTQMLTPISRQSNSVGSEI